MRIVVTVKQVPNPAGSQALDDDYTLARDADLLLDPGDEYGIEVGLRLREAHGGEVVLVSMGREACREAIKRGLAMGADRAVLVTDEGLRGADAFLTARVLAAVVRAESPDVLICGTESYDGSTGLVAPMMAEILDLPQLTFATSVDVEGGAVTIRRQAADGHQVVTAPAPCLISVTAGGAEPRYASLKGIMAARSKEIRTVGLTELDIAPGEPVETVVGIADVEQREAGALVHDDGTSGVQRILAVLRDAKAV